MYQAYRCHSERRSHVVCMHNNKNKNKNKRDGGIIVQNNIDDNNLAALAPKDEKGDEDRMEKLVVYKPNDDEEEMLVFCNDEQGNDDHKSSSSCKDADNAHPVQDVSTTEEGSTWSFSNEAEVEFLNSAVEEMRSEIQSLHERLELSGQECERLRETMKRDQEGDRQRVQFLVQALGNVSDPPTPMTQVAMEALSAEEATTLTITTLTRKVEQLSVENFTLKEEKIDLMERMQEVEGANDAMHLKIRAFELQFKTINNNTRMNGLSKLF